MPSRTSRGQSGPGPCRHRPRRNHPDQAGQHGRRHKNQCRQGSRAPLRDRGQCQDGASGGGGHLDAGKGVYAPLSLQKGGAGPGQKRDRYAQPHKRDFGPACRIVQKPACQRHSKDEDHHGGDAALNDSRARQEQRRARQTVRACGNHADRRRAKAKPSYLRSEGL